MRHTMWLSGVVAAATILTMGGAPAWAATSTATATVAATVTTRAEATLIRDGNSVTRFSAGQLVFDRFDDQDNQTDGNPNFMYAPYRSEPTKNWHILNMVANGSSMSLTAGVTGTAGSTPLANILQTFCGGFFESSAPLNSPPVANTKSTVWEPVNGFTRALSRPFVGIAPFNYRLNITGIPAGTFSGQITFTLTSN